MRDDLGKSILGDLETVRLTARQYEMRVRMRIPRIMGFPHTWTPDRIRVTSSVYPRMCSRQVPFSYGERGY